MADVYVATDDALERKVAIKVLNDRYAADSEIRLRFTREARIAARLSTEPNVVTIYDVTELGGRPAIVMELLSGGTLAERLARGPVAVAPALAWLEQAASALDAAHAEGVVHRDVKPANLMLGADGILRVTDFGIARIAGDSALTGAGTILGTSGYMSPEQAVGGTATPASDRYGLAVVAFELLTGRRPYRAETFAAEAAAHATAPVPVASGFNSELPKTVDSVLERGLAKDPDARYRSCSELVVSLRAAFSESAGTTVRTSPVAPLRTARTHRRRDRRVDRRHARDDGARRCAARCHPDAGQRRSHDGDDRADGDRRRRPRGADGHRRVAGAPSDRRADGRGRARGDPEPRWCGSERRGFRLLQAGDPTAALPLLEGAVAALAGSGSLDEAYASYNLAFARFSTGNCDGVPELLDRSEQIQGKRAEINRLRKDVRKSCDD